MTFRFPAEWMIGFLFLKQNVKVVMFFFRCNALNFGGILYIFFNFLLPFFFFPFCFSFCFSLHFVSRGKDNWAFLHTTQCFYFKNSSATSVIVRKVCKATFTNCKAKIWNFFKNPMKYWFFSISFEQLFQTKKFRQWSQSFQEWTVLKPLKKECIKI